MQSSRYWATLSGCGALRRACSSSAASAASSTTTAVSAAESDVQEEPKKKSLTLSAASVHRPPYYRKAHQHHKPRHMLQEEFPNRGDATGSNVRLWDYHRTAEMVRALPTTQEKIDYVSPYERPWSRAEKTWRRDWHPSLMASRKAWSVPSVPAYFDCFDFYKYITQTAEHDKTMDEIYQGLVPPTVAYEKFLSESLATILQSTRFDSEAERVDAMLAAVVDEALAAVAHNVPRLSELRASYDVQCESFWIRGGFDFLYEHQEIDRTEIEVKLHNTQKFTGDDRRKLGELAFVSRDRLAVQLRSTEAAAPLFSEESEYAKKEVFPDTVNVKEHVLYSPKVFNMWPDEDPLWQCPGYFVESGETHSFVHVAGKSLYDLDERIRHWAYPENEKPSVWEECARAQAVSSLFTMLNAQAHTHGFTQYTDVTRPFTSQLFLSNGRDFVFALGQLNTIAINLVLEEFVNEKTNGIVIESGQRLFETFDNGRFTHLSSEGEMKEGLNPQVLTRVLQMILRD